MSKKVIHSTKRIELSELATFLQCPARYSYNRQNKLIINPSVSTEHLVAQQAIQLIISILSRDNKNSLSFNQLQAIVHKLIYGSISQEEIELNFDTYETLVASTMNYVISWWNKDYVVNGYKAALINMPLELETIRQYYLIYNLPVLVLASKNGVGGFIFEDKSITGKEMYNKPFYQILAYMIYQTANKKLPVFIEHLSFANRAVNSSFMSINKPAFFSKVEQLISYGIAGIDKNIRFTNTSNECTICPYREICSFT